jgi:hypothetical protein|tara:strand:+ start:445 stop:843 length:399 start_codon:yes stop_codon:yes gene_type:complete
MTDEWNDEDISDEEVQAAVSMALGELLNIAAIAADLQSTDEGAEEIYAMCDLVAGYHGIERAILDTEENADGSFTTRVRDTNTDVPVNDNTRSSSPVSGSIRTLGKPKFRVIDKNSSNDTGFDDDEDDEGPQ